MKSLSTLAVLLSLLPFSARAQTPATVLAAAATSSAPGSAPVTCLLDPKCNGTWVPGAADSGVDDGIYLQFENPISAAYLQILAAGSNPKGNQEFRIYINGNTNAAQSRGKVASDADGNQLLQLNGGKALQIKSIFLKIEAPSEAGTKSLPLKKILFYPSVPDYQAILQGQVSPLPLNLPNLAPAAVTASSILEPVSAYHPAHLFDSQYDIAWSTDGKKSDGKEESFILNLQNPQTISGLMLWNGYQRSNEHFKANGRVIEAEIQGDTGTPFRIKLADQMGAQKISFPQALANVRQLRFTIKAIAPGTSYKDVLISELRLLGPDGKLVLPQVALPKVAAPAAFAGMLNRSFASILHQPVAGPPLEVPDANLSNRCDNSRIRLRDNGTFVVYKGFNYGKSDSAEKPTNINADVQEGNWEPKGESLRIFGKKYVTALQQSEYLQGPATGAPRVQIFQSEVSAKPYRSLTPAEKQALFAFLWAKKKGAANKAQKFTWAVGTTHWYGTDQSRKNLVEGTNYDALVKNLDTIFQELNPIYVSSSVLTDLFLPTDETESCYSGATGGE